MWALLHPAERPEPGRPRPHVTAAYMHETLVACAHDPATRQAAFELLQELMAGCAGNMGAGMEALMELHCAAGDQVRREERWRSGRVERARLSCTIRSRFRPLLSPRPRLTSLLARRPLVQPRCARPRLQVHRLMERNGEIADVLPPFPPTHARRCTA